MASLEDDLRRVNRERIATLHEFLVRKNMVNDDEKLIAVRQGVLKAIMEYVPQNVKEPQ